MSDITMITPTTKMTNVTIRHLYRNQRRYAGASIFCAVLLATSVLLTHHHDRRRLPANAEELLAKRYESTRGRITITSRDTNPRNRRIGKTVRVDYFVPSEEKPIGHLKGVITDKSGELELSYIEINEDWQGCKIYGRLMSAFLLYAVQTCKANEWEDINEIWLEAAASFLAHYSMGFRSSAMEHIDNEEWGAFRYKGVTPYSEALNLAMEDCIQSSRSTNTRSTFKEFLQKSQDAENMESGLNITVNLHKLDPLYEFGMKIPNPCTNDLCVTVRKKFSLCPCDGDGPQFILKCGYDDSSIPVKVVEIKYKKPLVPAGMAELLKKAKEAGLVN